MDNKNLIFINEIFDYNKQSVESAHSLGLNKWKGWWCAAGLRSLYIDFDGNVWRGTCTEGGWIGNINSVTGLSNGPELLQNKWVHCSLDVCSCGADMAVPKVKTHDLIDVYTNQDVQKKLNREFEVLKDPNIVFSDANKEYKSIIWDIGRLCNFDCSYCSKNSHNNYDPVKNLKYMMNVYNNINKFWNVKLPSNNFRRERLKFSITGGEPTVYKDYLPFVKKLKEDDQIIMTTTNGSNSTEYYKELAKYSDIAFSIHLKYVGVFGVDKFVNNAVAAAETTQQGHLDDTSAKYNWIIVRIMLDPGNLEIAKKVYASFTEELQGFKNCIITVDLLHTADGDSHQLYEYSDEEIEWIERIHA